MRRSHAVQLLVLSVVVAATIGVYNWPQLTTTIELRLAYRNDAEMWRTPVPLPDTSISNIARRKTSCQGYEFELPWEDVAAQKDVPLKQLHMTTTAITFVSGDSMSFSTNDFMSPTLAGLLTQLGSLHSEDAERLVSTFDFRREVLEATPAQIDPFLSRREMIRVSTLLAMKLASPPSSDGLYEFQTKDFRGFQFEKRESRAIDIVDQLFGPDGTVTISFFERAPGWAPTLTQPEINRVLQSIHKIPTLPPAPTKESRP